jgi:ABC-2 type transport system ATP-binding protein
MYIERYGAVMNDFIIEINKLKKYYGKTRGVEDVSIKIKKGETYGFIGPNGAGKSTTIRAIMNLINKSSGKVLFNGKKLDKNSIKLKKQIGYLPSEVSLYDDLNVKEMLDYHESFYENIHSRRVELVNRLELDETKKIEDLSLGNLKKLGIILAFMHNPKLIILDEPTSGLDPIMQQTFFELLKEENEKGTTIFYSTHVLSEIQKICNRVGIIKEGKLLNIETINDLQKKNFSIITIISKEINEIVKDLKIKTIYKDENTIKFKNTTSANTLLKKISNYKIDKILIEEPTLEEVLLHYYK